MRAKRLIMSITLAALGVAIAGCAAILLYGQAQDKQNARLYMRYVESKPITASDTQSEQPPISVDWKSLTEQNPEVVGWVYVDADNDKDIISYPVLYRKGDRDHYLRHDITGTYSKYGVPYIPGDYDLDGKVISIHGHNFGDGEKAMFSPLLKYESYNYAINHQIVWYGGAGETLEPYKICSVMQYDCTDLDSGADCWNYLQTQWTSDDDYVAWLTEAKNRSLFDLEYQPTSDDGVIILSTCQTAQATSLRCVIIAVKEGD